MNRLTSCSLFCLTWIFGLGGCGDEDSDQKKLRVGLVADVGTLEDNTYNSLANSGCLRAANDFDLSYDFVECQSVDDYQKNIKQFAEDGYDHVVTLAFMMGDSTKLIAETHPDTNFAIMDYQYAEYTTNNLMGIAFREDQGGYLAGVVAGQVSQQNVVGCLGGIEIPAIKRFCNGFAQGVKHVCASCTTFIEYAGSFGNKDDGETTAQSLIGQGVDVIFQAAGYTGSCGIAYAAERDIWVIGVDQDEYRSTFGAGTIPGADKILTSVIKKVDEAAYFSVEATVKDTFVAGSVTFSLQNHDAFELAPYHDAAAQIATGMQTEIDAAMTGLSDGSLDTGVDPVTGDLVP